MKKKHPRKLKVWVVVRVDGYVLAAYRTKNIATSSRIKEFGEYIRRGVLIVDEHESKK